jgi:hypothetical protein
VASNAILLESQAVGMAIISARIGNYQRRGRTAANDALQLEERRMGDEGEQHRPHDRNQEGAEQQVKLIAHHGQEAEEENMCNSFAIHSGPPLAAELSR